jgi:molybdenum cofactor cytidylyltransferase
VWVGALDRQGDDKRTVGAIILAAGASNRIGRPKQLLEFRGESLIRRAAAAALHAECGHVVIVTGANAEAMRYALRGLNVQEVENPQWESGMASSIRIGTAAIMAANPKTDAIVLMLCDQPFVTSEVIGKLINAHRETGCSIVASSYGDTFGVPALFEKSHYAELKTLEGDSGAKEIIQEHLARAQLVNFPEGAIDIDTPEDFARLG